jgi:hypothetical protein
MTLHRHRMSRVQVALVVSMMLFAAYMGLAGSLGMTAQAQTGANAPIGYTDFLWVYPSQGAATPAYANLISLKEEYPSVPMVAIVNNGNGAGLGQDSNYVSAINAMRAVGITVIGYVYCIITYGTTPGSRNLIGSDSVYGSSDNGRGLEQAIDAWGTYYKIDGIYFDNAVPGYPAGTDGLSNPAPGWSGHTLLQYYQAAVAYGKSKYGFTYSMANVANVYPAMIGVANTLNLENYPHGSPLPIPSILESLTTGVGGASADFSLVAWLETTVPSVAYLSSIKGYISFISVTNTNDQPSASYQDALVANLNQVAAPSQVKVSVSQPNGAGTLPYWTISGLTPDGHFSVHESIASIGYSMTYSTYTANAAGGDYREFTVGGAVAGDVVSLTVTNTATGATASTTYTVK